MASNDRESGSPVLQIAIIGGGITGAVAASHIASSTRNAYVTLFDQGRRGPGGRASHRAVDDQSQVVLPDDPPIPPAALEFDHGCQFFRADHPRMRALADGWLANGWVAEWQGRFGVAGKASELVDFFGLPSNDAPVYVGVGGMHLLPRKLLAACDASRVTVQRGVRVAGMRRDNDGAWSLLGVSGAAAYHDTKESEAQQIEQHVIGCFHLVLLTDVSSSFGGWHRASAGVPDSFGARVRERVRIPLFTAMVAFKDTLGLALDGITFGGSAVWFAARTQSKPGLASGGAGCECWTLVSTPGFAVDELRTLPMQDPVTGAFRPQEDGYLNAGPAPALLEAFLAAVAQMRSSSAGATGEALPVPPVVYLQGQRWGSALPAPCALGGRDIKGRGQSTVRLMDVEYEAATPPLVYERPAAAAAPDGSTYQYQADDDLGLFYAGDFASRHAPGLEAAALSGLAAAEHISRLCSAKK